MKANKKIAFKTKFGCIFCFVLFVATSSWAQTVVDSTFDLYLLIGQSNMAGRGEITEEYKSESNPKILMLDKENNWVQARHPLHFDKPSVAGVGPGLRFALEMIKATGDKKIGLVPCAVGGTSIDVWKPGGYDKATNTYPYDHAIKRLATAMQSGIIKGVLWLQGESDSDSIKAKNYLPKITDLINRIRTVTGTPSLPFVAGELGRFKTQYQNINRELARLPGTVPFTAIVSSYNLIDKGDKTHFDGSSANEYGKRFADAVKKLRSK